MKQIWENDTEYKFYLEQIFASLHEANGQTEIIPKDLVQFYEKNGVAVSEHIRKKKNEFTILNWGIDDQQIQAEMDRQGMNSSDPVTLLFAMKWFHSDLFNKGANSKLVKDLKGENNGHKVKSENELISLCYLSYLETNNYLKANQKYLFGDLVKMAGETIY